MNVIFCAEVRRVRIAETSQLVWLLVARVGEGRKISIKFGLWQDQADLCRQLLRALESYGGSPRQIAFDNQKIQQADGSAGSQP
jgi:hypothetical protein